MKRFTLSFLLATCFVLLTACGSKTVFDETREFSSAWNRFKPEVFIVDISKPDGFYDLYLTVCVDTARYHANTLPVNVNIESSAGERRMFPSTVTLRDKKNEWKGEWRDGLLIVDQRIRDCLSFNNSGEHQIKIGQATHYYEIAGIRSLRFHIEPTEMDFPE